jgi:hypothetical protein
MHEERQVDVSQRCDDAARIYGARSSRASSEPLQPNATQTAREPNSCYASETDLKPTGSIIGFDTRNEVWRGDERDIHESNEAFICTCLRSRLRARLPLGLGRLCTPAGDGRVGMSHRRERDRERPH